MCPPKSAISGFSLVELLIAVGIIGVLAAILLPVFGMIRARATATTCSNNLHQLHAAFALYAQDNDTLLPPYCNNRDMRQESTPPDNGLMLVRGLEAYTRSKPIWFCPSDPFAGRSRTYVTENHNDNLVVNHKHSSYLYHLGYDPILRPLPMPVDFHKLSYSTAEVPLLSDNPWGCKDTTPTLGNAPYSHGGRNLTIFLDGHIRSYGWADAQCVDVDGMQLPGTGK